MLSLKNHLQKIPQNSRIPIRRASRGFSCFAIATLLSGVNWYVQNQMLYSKNETENELIKRVANDETQEDFNGRYNYHDANNWDCKKVTLDCQLMDGRFIVKRKRGDQEGYLVLAPISISQGANQATNQKIKYYRKFVVNMGWVPKSSKHMIKSTCTSDTLGQNDYTEDPVAAREINRTNQDYLGRATVFQDYYWPVTTITAYVRKGEQENKARGYSNFKDSKLFKFIDLNLIGRAFFMPDIREAQTVYFDRVARNEDQAQNMPIPTSKQQVIADLKKNIEWNENEAKRGTRIFFGTAYLTALAFTLI